jgi:hypothetical protein
MTSPRPSAACNNWAEIFFINPILPKEGNMQKRVICPQRIRKIPKQFSWVDHRLVRDRYIDQCSHGAAALYLFLITVADARGLSYYSDVSISQRLNMNDHDLSQARLALVRVGLIAYQKPLYQVLGLEETPRTMSKRSSTPPQSLGHIFKQIIKEAT